MYVYRISEYGDRLVGRIELEISNLAHQHSAESRSLGAWLYFRLCIDLFEWSTVGFSQQTASVVSWWWQIFIFPSSSTTTSKQLA
jgi:hypothetical protein